MDQLLEEHQHRLDQMYQDLQTSLSRLPALYQHYGYESWMAFVGGWKAGIADQPLVVPAAEGGVGTAEGYQYGTPYVPYTHRAMVHAGEMIIPAPVAQAFREGAAGVTLTIENLNVGAGVSAFTADYFARQTADQLGFLIRQQTR